MPSLAKLQANTASAEIDFGDGDVLHVTYYPRRITGEMMTAYLNVAPKTDVTDEAALEAVTSVVAVTDNLLAIIKAWDLTDTDPDSGAEVPVVLTRDGLRGVGMVVQWGIFNGIMLSLNQGEAAARQAAKDAPSVSKEA